MNYTFAIIKPDACMSNKVGPILNDLVTLGFRIENMTYRYLTLSEAEDLYIEHKDKSRFNELVDFMLSSKVVLLKLSIENDNAVEKLRWFIGPAQESDRQSWHLRSKYSTNYRKNAIHASDSISSAVRELAIFNF